MNIFTLNTNNPIRAPKTQIMCAHYTSDQNESPQDNDLFMKDFKLYKRIKDFNPDHFPGLIILDRLNSSNVDNFNLKRFNVSQIPDSHVNDIVNYKYGLKEARDWICFESVESPGLYFISNPFKPGYQRFFVKKCLADYPNLPNKTNLDLHMDRTGINLWEDMFKKKNFKEFNKLRWATLGYHYDWTNKIYNNDDFTPVPEDVSNLCTYVASLLGFSSYSAEAGIVNFYHLDSTLSAHQDRSEKNMNAPLISISLGSSAIFLIGGTSKSERAPQAILLKSGDIVVMSGAARLAYHAVPKILPDPNIKAYFEYSDDDDDDGKIENLSSHYYVGDEEWADFFEYIKINRINMNIRQVN